MENKSEGEIYFINSMGQVNFNCKFQQFMINPDLLLYIIKSDFVNPLCWYIILESSHDVIPKVKALVGISKLKEFLQEAIELSEIFLIRSGEEIKLSVEEMKEYNRLLKELNNGENTQEV